MVHSYLKDGKQEEVLEKGRKALREHQDSLSESDSSGRERKEKRKRILKEKALDAPDKGKGEARLYPTLDTFCDEFAHLDISEGENGLGGHPEERPKSKSPGRLDQTP